MSSVLITGGAGLLGELLKRRLLEPGFSCVSIDLEKSAGSACTFNIGSDDVKSFREVYQAAPMGIIKLLKWLS